jgi:hypothetical protein
MKYNMNTPKGRLQYLRDTAFACLRREMPCTYDAMPANWCRLRIPGIQRHLNRIHYTKWPEKLKMAFDACMNDAYGPISVP